ncbi:hypothetical protein [Haloplanus aerogenes]|uniref:Uncharacterized protein n=1 Tax=Haloplanus aerogenes TaxID=660522 RepID=A0A3M0CHE1_9EURY|nr:hypothetical protein [Haloplanus aerogenes]AZH26040.1 hypothetical protein DU502_12020 [Haloplanus aerogenes]RMB08227.1 hypothetical protein ATH50_3640 [Haloplanus aerogenes]
MDTRLALAVGLVVGLIVGAAGGAAAGAALIPTQSVSSPSFSTSAGTGCVSNPATGGWVGQVPNGETRTVALNFTFTHDVTDVNVRANLTEPSPGHYRFTVEVAPGDGAKGQPPADCTPRTTFDALVSLPGDFRTVTVVLDGAVVTQVEHPEDSFATFRTLSGNYSVAVDEDGASRLDSS